LLEIQRERERNFKAAFKQWEAHVNSHEAARARLAAIVVAVIVGPSPHPLHHQDADPEVARVVHRVAADDVIRKVVLLVLVAVVVQVVIEAGVGNDEETEADQSHHQNIESNGTLVIAKTPVDLDV